MKRLALTLLGTLALVGQAQSAAAQNANTAMSAFSQNLEVRIDDKKIDNDTVIYVGQTRCEEETKYEFKGIAYNTGGGSITVLEAWVSTGTNCFTAASRAQVTTSTPQCWKLDDDANSVTTTGTIRATAPEIFKANADDPSGKCPDVSGTTYTVYLVPLAAATNSNPASPPEPIMGAQQLKAVFTLNQVTPNGPENIKGFGGESEVRLTWNKASDAKAKSEYYVIWDVSNGSDETCSNSMLKAGKPPPEADGESLIKSKNDIGTKASLGDLDEKGVALGDYVAATVIHVDVAGNLSNQSKVMCLKHEETSGIETLCASDPTCNDGFHTCALSPGAGRGGTAGLALLLGLGSILFLRRRRA